jgi:hypothetical protein
LFAFSFIPKAANASPPAAARIVHALAKYDLNGNSIDDRLETIVGKGDCATYPGVLVKAGSTYAALYGFPKSKAPVADLMVDLNHAPTAADVAKVTSLGFKVKNVFQTAIYALHVVGPLPNGVTTLKAFTNPANKLGVTWISPNYRATPQLFRSTRQIGARQAWPEFANENEGAALTGLGGNSIAILDSGVDSTHTDFFNNGSSKIVAWQDEVGASVTTPDPGQYVAPIDIYAHGTAMAGIAAGTGASAGIATGTGYLPFLTNNLLPVVAATAPVAGTRRFNATAPPALPYTTYFPVDTSGYSTSPNIELTAFWADPVKGAIDSFEISNIPPAGQTALTSTFTSATDADQPIGGIVPVATGVTGQYTFLASTNLAIGSNPFSAQILTPMTSEGDNFNLVSGVAPGSSLVGVKVLDDTGLGSTATIAAGITYIESVQAQYNIGVANFSLAEAVVDPTLDTAVNGLVKSGIVAVAAAGNLPDGGASTLISSPASASDAITVGALNPTNGLTGYDVAGVNEPNTPTGSPVVPAKPDVEAPGGDVAQDQLVIAPQSNSSDQVVVGGVVYPNPTSNFPLDPSSNYGGYAGTSVSAAHIAGAVALLQQAIANNEGTPGGVTFTPTQALFMKTLIEMTATDVNVAGDAGTVPTLNRGPKDTTEGYGKVNVDAALEGMLLSYVPGLTATATLSADPLGKKCWAREVSLSPGTYTFTLNVPVNCDYDLYLYSSTGQPDSTVIVAPALTAPQSYGISGDPVILASSVVVPTAGLATTQTFSYTATGNQNDYLVVKWVAGTGPFTLSSLSAVTSDTITGVVSSAANGSIPVAPIEGATVTIVQTTNSQVLGTATTDATGTYTLPVPAGTKVTVTASAFGYLNGVVTTTTPAATLGAQTITENFTLSAAHVFSAGLQLVSSPYTYGTNNVPFSELLSPNADAAVWSTVYKRYVVTPAAPANTFTSGQGYWFNFAQPTTVVQPGTGYTGKVPLSIPLGQGWNMIGDPYTQNVGLGNCTYQTQAGQQIPYNLALGANLISILFGWDPVNQSYIAVGSSGTIQPWAGYWVFSTEPGAKLILPVP